MAKTKSDPKNLREQIMREMRYHRRGLPPHRHLYSVTWDGVVYSANDTRELADQVERAVNTVGYERVSKKDGSVSPANEYQVRHGLESAVHDVELALEQIAQGAEIGNNFFIYRKARA